MQLKNELEMLVERLKVRACPIACDNPADFP